MTAMSNGKHETPAAAAPEKPDARVAVDRLREQMTALDEQRERHMKAKPVRHPPGTAISLCARARPAGGANGLNSARSAAFVFFRCLAARDCVLPWPLHRCGS